MSDLRLVGDGPAIRQDGAVDPDHAIVRDYQADARTQGPMVPEEVAACLRWAGSYQLPGQPPAVFWAEEVLVGQDARTGLADSEALLINALIDTSEWQMQQRQGAQMPVMVRRRRTWRRQLHLFGVALVWAEISEQQRQQARG